MKIMPGYLPEYKWL